MCRDSAVLLFVRYFGSKLGVSTSVRLLNPFGHGIVGNPVTFIGVSLNSQILV